MDRRSIQPPNQKQLGAAGVSRQHFPISAPYTSLLSTTAKHLVF